MSFNSKNGKARGPVLWWKSYKRCPICKAYLMASYDYRFYCLKCEYREGLAKPPIALTESFGVPELPGYHV